MKLEIIFRIIDIISRGLCSSKSGSRSSIRSGSSVCVYDCLQLVIRNTVRVTTLLPTARDKKYSECDYIIAYSS
jgi:hypothetical protein